ncbi:MAG TPA: S41 family peptidase [Desulfobacteraceae bacterium]|nr:S41 family peptidase [Desulfobacteraceae bacterium]
MKISLYYLLLVLFLMIPAPVPADENVQREETYKNLEAFSTVLMLLQQHYVDPIDPHDVIMGAINGMLTSLDPHSSYLSPDDFTELQEETHGSFSGIGIEITMKDGILTVVSPIEDTPAYRAGIKAGDQIIRIDGGMTKNLTLMDAVKKLRGRKGTSVTISIHRSEWQELKDFNLVRDDIPLQSVKSLELEPGLLYVRISNFQAKTTRDLRETLRTHGKQGPIQGLILDLRNNPGGLLDQAVKTADVFLSQGVIVFTRGRVSEEDLIFEAHPEDDINQFPMIVLVNGGSASASEIVAGALQDHKKAIVLGTETFGKGSVQTIIPMPDGGGLRLTTARYFTPSGESIQATGIKPDIVVPFIPPENIPQTVSEGQQLREKDLPNHIEHEERKDQPASEGSGKEAGGDDPVSEAEQRLRQDNQLRNALYILKGLNIASQQAEREKEKAD